MASKNFGIPQYGNMYIHSITDRCENLIHHGIWNGIHITRYKKWWSNFRTEEEQYFAACVIDSLIYRSEDQTIAIMKQLLQRTLPDLNNKNPMPIGIHTNFEDILKKRPYSPDPKMRLVTVLGGKDPHSKSSPTIARLF